MFFKVFSITVDNAFVNIVGMTELTHHLLQYVGSNASVNVACVRCGPGAGFLPRSPRPMQSP
jgi:hypothetical protein